MAAAGAGLLTDGVIGGNNWLSHSVAIPGLDGFRAMLATDGGVDSGVPQPQLTFDLGGNYFVDTVTIHYIVDYPAGALRANLHAPDSMTATSARLVRVAPSIGASAPLLLMTAPKATRAEAVARRDHSL